jgi:hypothetical protein
MRKIKFLTGAAVLSLLLSVFTGCELSGTIPNDFPKSFRVTGIPAAVWGNYGSVGIMSSDYEVIAAGSFGLISGDTASAALTIAPGQTFPDGKYEFQIFLFANQADLNSGSGLVIGYSSKGTVTFSGGVNTFSWGQQIESPLGVLSDKKITITGLPWVNSGHYFDVYLSPTTTPSDYVAYACYGYPSGNAITRQLIIYPGETFSNGSYYVFIVQFDDEDNEGTVYASNSKFSFTAGQTTPVTYSTSAFSKLN